MIFLLLFLAILAGLGLLIMLEYENRKAWLTAPYKEVRS